MYQQQLLSPDSPLKTPVVGVRGTLHYLISRNKHVHVFNSILRKKNRKLSIYKLYIVIEHQWRKKNKKCFRKLNSLFFFIKNILFCNFFSLFSLVEAEPKILNGGILIQEYIPKWCRKKLMLLIFLSMGKGGGLEDGFNHLKNCFFLKWYNIMFSGGG